MRLHNQFFQKIKSHHNSQTNSQTQINIKKSFIYDQIKCHHKKFLVTKPILYNYAIECQTNLKNQIRQKKKLRKKHIFMRINHNHHTYMLPNHQLDNQSSNRKIQTLLSKNQKSQYLANKQYFNNHISIRNIKYSNQANNFLSNKASKSQNNSLSGQNSSKFEKYNKNIYESHFPLSDYTNNLQHRQKNHKPKQVLEDYELTGWVQ